MAAKQGSKKAGASPVSKAGVKEYKAAIAAYNKRIAAATLKTPDELKSKLPKKIAWKDIKESVSGKSDYTPDIKALKEYNAKSLQFELREGTVKTVKEWRDIDRAIAEENKRRQARREKQSKYEQSVGRFRTIKQKYTEPINTAEFLRQRPERQKQLVQGAGVKDWVDPVLADFQRRWLTTMDMNYQITVMKYPGMVEELNSVFTRAYSAGNALDPELFYQAYLNSPEMDFRNISNIDELVRVLDEIASILEQARSW